MVNLDPRRRPALAGIVANGLHGRKLDVAGVVVTEQWPLSIAAILSFKGRSAEVTTRLQNSLGLVAHTSPLRNAVQRPDGSSLSLAWAGPGKWIAVDERGGDLEQELSSALSDAAMVVDQSDSCCVMRVVGRDVRAMLAKGLPVDIGEREFRTGSVAITEIDHIGVHCWQLDDIPRFELMVERSYAQSLLEWLIGAAAEFGCDVSLARPPGA